MPKVFPEVIKQPFEQPPLGTLVWQIMDAYENMIGMDNPKYGVSVELEATEPVDAVGVAHTENFPFGIDDDPGDLENGVSDETFAARAGRFDTFCQKCDVDIRNKGIDVTCQEIRDRNVKSNNEARQQPQILNWGPNRGQPNPNAGRWNVRPRWLHISEGGVPEIKGTVADLEAAAPAAVATQPATAPAPPPARRSLATAPAAQPAAAVPPAATAPTPAAPRTAAPAAPTTRPSPVRPRPAAPARR